MSFRLSARERIDQLNARLADVADEPSVYGNKVVGSRLYGVLQDKALGPYWLRGEWFSLFGAPLFLRGVYLVDDPNGPPCRFFGRLGRGDFRRIFAGGTGGLYRTTLSEGAKGYALLAMVVAFVWLWFVEKPW